MVKVNFGQGGDAKGGTMRIRKSNPKARKSFRARHNCDRSPRKLVQDIKKDIGVVENGKIKRSLTLSRKSVKKDIRHIQLVKQKRCLV